MRDSGIVYLHRRHMRVLEFTASCQRDHFLKTSGNQYRPQSQASHNLDLCFRLGDETAARAIIDTHAPPYIAETARWSVAIRKCGQPRPGKP